MEAASVPATQVKSKRKSKAPTAKTKTPWWLWLAVTAIGEPIPPQTPVIVTAITGTTLTVRPQHYDETAKAEHP